MKSAIRPGIPALLLPLLFLFTFIPCPAQFTPATGPGSAPSIPQAQLIQPEALDQLFKNKAADKPLLLQVGSHQLFDQAHISGSYMPGQARSPLACNCCKAVAALSKKKSIVLYCGCCPWNRCPNLAPAYKQLHDAGFTNVKASTSPTIWVPIGPQRDIRLNGRSSSSAIRAIAAVLLVAASLATGAARPVLAQTSPVHKRAPEFVRTDLNHHRLDLNAYRGKVAVLLNFWATWCAPCQLEMPRFVAWQNQYGPRGLRVVGISMDDDPALARAAYRKLKLNYPVAMGNQKLGELYGGVLGLPITYLIDAQGDIRARYEGESDLNKIETQLQSLLPRR